MSLLHTKIWLHAADLEIFYLKYNLEQFHITYVLYDYRYIHIELFQKLEYSNISKNCISRNIK